MRTRLFLVILLIPVLGFIAALISGFHEQNLSVPGLSKIGYGFPLMWYGHSWIVYPDTPVVYWFSWESFLLDVAFWTLTIASIMVIVVFMQSKARKTGA